MNHDHTDLAHEIYAASQRAPGEGVEDAAERITEILAENHDSPWISVKNKLPEVSGRPLDSTKVLAFWETTDPDYDPGGIETSWFDGRRWQGANGDMDYHGSRRVTHWMPLPAEPRSDQSEG